MKIAVYGTGGVGGYFGGLLANAEYDVTFIARGAHLEALCENGLQVNSINGDFSIESVKATNDLAEIGQVDYVILAVKHYHLTDVVPQMHPLIGEKTTLVPLLNGVDAHDFLIKAYGPRPVVGGLCSLVSMIEAPGIIRQPSKLRRVVVGELDRTKSERVEKIVNAWKELGVEAIHAEDIYAPIWTKFLFISSFGGIGSLTRADMGSILQNTETRQLFIDAMREVEVLARTQDINLAPDVIDTTLTMAESFEPTATSSMQRDVAAGNLFELEAFNGKIVHLGRALGVPVHIHRAIYALLLPALEKAVQAAEM
jgi:2-dehydropantoate 2-reductase